MEGFDGYHDCGFCRTMVINAMQSPLGPGENVPDLIFFFEPMLDSLLAASSTCHFSQWLIARWSKSTACDWEDLRSRSREIAICVSYLSNTFDQFPIVEVLWIGLWDPKEECRPEIGRCRVFDEVHLDVVAAAGMHPRRHRSLLERRD